MKGEINMKNITTIIGRNRKTIVRKSGIVLAATLGICIGLLMNKTEEDDMVIINGEVSDDDVTIYRPVEEMTEEEVKDMDSNTSS